MNKVPAYTQMASSPFDLNDASAYQQWREHKLEILPSGLEAITVEIKDLGRPSNAEKAALTACLRDCNMAIYASNQPSPGDKTEIRQLCHEFGLERLDHNMGADDEGITELEVKNDASHKRYIPYTNRAIGWHTDGYYNISEQSIRAMVLHCVAPASRGGGNALLDHELAYIHLRDINPDYIHALMQPDVMTIPANIVDGKTLRPDRSCPVFSIDSVYNLHMRFTERKYNIIWKDDPVVSAAIKALVTLLHSDSPYIFRGTLEAGQGLICNNVLHNRTGFEDDENHTRLLYRLRYYDRIAA
jgi:alpha-ketoglutarate-dependent taurine dioxygenase